MIKAKGNRIARRILGLPHWESNRFKNRAGRHCRWRKNGKWRRKRNNPDWQLFYPQHNSKLHSAVAPVSGSATGDF